MRKYVVGFEFWLKKWSLKRDLPTTIVSMGEVPAVFPALILGRMVHTSTFGSALMVKSR